MLDNRKEFFPVRLVRHWSRLPLGFVDVPSVEVFKAGLDCTLSKIPGLEEGVPIHDSVVGMK